MAQETFTGPFHQVGRDDPRFIKYSDGKLLAKSFPVQDPALHGSKDHKDYFVKIEDNVYWCVLCEKKATDAWGCQSHMMHHHPNLCNFSWEDLFVCRSNNDRCKESTNLFPYQ